LPKSVANPITKSVTNQANPLIKPTSISPQSAARAAFRVEIRHAAERVFGTKGFGATKMADVAAEAGVGVGTLYNYFASKEEIFEEIFAGRSDEFHALIERATDGLPPIDQVAAIIRTSMEYLEQHGALFAMFFERGGIGELDIERLGGKVLEQGYTRFLSRLELAMQSAVDSGELRGDIPVATLVAGLSGARNGTVYQWLKGGRRGQLRDATENLLKLFLSGARAQS
jgi:AcrR family transcriptional regulator